jgi:hypothetical protein
MQSEVISESLNSIMQPAIIKQRSHEGAFGHPFVAGAVVALVLGIVHAAILLSITSANEFYAVFFASMISYPVLAFGVAPLLLFWKVHKGWWKYEIIAAASVCALIGLAIFFGIFILVLGSGGQ